MSLLEALNDFIPGLLQAFFNFFMTAIVTVIQVITWPINVVLTTAFPDLSSQITNVSTSLSQLTLFFPYLFSFLPPVVSSLIFFIIGVELILLLAFRSSFFVAKLWGILQRVKFW